MNSVRLNANYKFKDNDTIICSFKELYDLVQQINNKKDVYSTEETLTNKLYLNKPVYRRVFTGKNKDFDIDIPNIDELVDLYGKRYASYGQYWPIPCYHTEAGYCNGYYIEKTSKRIHIWCGGFYTNNSDYSITVEYTKKELKEG